MENGFVLFKSVAIKLSLSPLYAVTAKIFMKGNVTKKN